jgi:hypothetical protein
VGEMVDEDGVVTFYDDTCALISHFLHIPFPEQLEETVWLEKARQVWWMNNQNLLPVKIKRK